jgi:hypothetical protein
LRKPFGAQPRRAIRFVAPPRLGPANGLVVASRGSSRLGCAAGIMGYAEAP